ncbi:hypothetical protein VTK56DRAFT_6434 [Thermocarpiscus australiensis]
MYLIKATQDFQRLAERVCLSDDEFTVVGGVRAMPLEKILRRREIGHVVGAYYADGNKTIEEQAKGQGKTIQLRRAVGLIHLEGGLPADGQIYVVIAVPPPQPPGDRAAAAGSSPSGGFRTTYEVVVRKSDREENITLQNGDILRLDEDEKIEAKSGGIALILLKYSVVPESHGH